MCGIAGFLGAGSRQDLEAMTRTLAHRGPDGEGFFWNDEVGLGHRRLSIIDLVSGAQPMESPSGESVIVFNGEIYNFLSLRKELQDKGVKFRTASDTEVILAGYEMWGHDVLRKLDGMFAFALWDKNRHELFLARDRFGKKPLYWAQQGKVFLFGSELKALHTFSGFFTRINHQALAKYLFYDFVPSPDGIFEGVKKLDGGHFLVAGHQGIKIEKYFDLEKNVTNPEIFFGKGALQNPQETFLKLFHDAVEKRLISDVPLGVFLSGGIDSSAVAAMAQKISGTRVKTFSIGFSEKEFDESRWARLVARRIGSEHYEKIFSLEDALNVVDKIPLMADEPLADASLLPTYLLSQFARQHVTVALGGDGGDELFLGYPTFGAEKLFAALSFLPASASKKILGTMQSILPVGEGYMGLDLLLGQFRKGLSGSVQKNIGARHEAWLGAFGVEEAQSILSEDFSRSINWANILEDVLPISSQENKYRYLSRLYLKRYLQDEVLVKVDRASMAVGLETRAPFLDTKLAQFVLDLDTKYKLRGFSGKRLLRQAMRDMVPQEVIGRKKKGFGVPLDRWLRRELRGPVTDALLSKDFTDAGIFRHEAIEKILQEHFERKANHRKKIWNLFVLALWLKSIK